MKILHILDERWDSGITHYGLDLAQIQHEHGHQVTVAARAGYPAAKRAHARGLTCIEMSRAHEFFVLRGFVRRTRPAVIHAHTGHATALGLLVKLPGMILVRSRGDARAFKHTWMNRWVLARTDRIICAAHYIAEDVFHAFPTLPKGAVTVVYPGIAVGDSAPAVRQPHGRPIAIGMIGRLDPVKGHSVFINAARIVREYYRDTRFYIAGKEENVHWKELDEMLSRLSLREAFTYLGYVPDPRAFMNTMDIGVIASVGSEAIARVALEWMAAARPLVASRVGCLGELVEDGVSGLLHEPGDYRGLAERLLALMRSPDQMERVGKNAYLRVQRSFSQELFYSGVARAYGPANDSTH